MLLYGVEAHDPLVYGTIAALLGGTAWLASCVPARRASRMNPWRTLRAE